MLRRSLLLAAISIGGIGLLAPLAARSATLGPVVEISSALLPLTEGPTLMADRGGLAGRQASAQAGGADPAEDLAADAFVRPAAAPMEATLYGVAASPPALPTSASSEPTASAQEGVWDALAACESGGNWSINTGNGYYGGLQFSFETWHTYGGGTFAEYPHRATREQQIIVAEHLRAERGYAPWPTCATELGLT